MRYIFLLLLTTYMSLESVAQGDLLMLMNPLRNTDTLVLNNRISGAATVDDEDQGESFGLLEHELSLRYALSLKDTSEYYLTVDTYAADIDTDGAFDSNLVTVPSELRDVSTGLLFRRDLGDTWKIGGTLRVGSASDELFHSGDEWYFRSLVFLQKPRSADSAWLILASVDTNREFPVVPGAGYVFRFGKRSMGVLGFPFAGAAGQISSKWNYRFAYWPLNNVDARLSYRASRKWRPYTGFRWQNRYFSRADRDDSDDRILLEDARVFVGSTYTLTRKATLDLRSGVILAREIGEGDDQSDRDDNNLEVKDAWYGSLAVNVRF